MDEDIRDITFFAFRYALGRRTFAPYIVCTFIKRHLNIFFDSDLEQMAREITEHKRMFGDIGDPKIDEPDWLKFREFLMEELDRRNKTPYTEDK